LSNTQLFVDASHAGDWQPDDSQVTDQSPCIWENNAPIVVWYSKCQNTVESSVFGLEFVAMKNGMETIRRLQCKLRMTDGRTN
jgi:hypothetical protein